MTDVLDAVAASVAVVPPQTSMTSVAVEGGSAFAVATLLELLSQRVRAIGDVEVHDIVVSPASDLMGYSTATVYFVV